MQDWRPGTMARVERDGEESEPLRLVDVDGLNPCCEPGNVAVYRTRRGGHVMRWETPDGDSQYVSLDTCSADDLYMLLAALQESPAEWERLPAVVYARLRGFVERSEI